jgi:hypothetical protein
VTRPIYCGNLKICVVPYVATVAVTLWTSHMYGTLLSYYVLRRIGRLEKYVVISEELFEYLGVANWLARSIYLGSLKYLFRDLKVFI